jgi:hypothetical protein
METPDLHHLYDSDIELTSRERKDTGFNIIINTCFK